MKFVSSCRAFVDALSVRQILVSAFVLRLVFGLVFINLDKTPAYGPLDGPQGDDAGVDGYLQIGYTLLHHGRYAFEATGPLVSFRGPVQPLLMLVTCAWSAKYWAYFWIIAASAMGTFIVFLTSVLMRTMGTVSASFQKIAMILVAVYPYMIFSTKTPSLLITIALIFTAICLLVSTFVAKPMSFGAAVTSGILAGVSILLHGVFMPIILVALILLLALMPGSFSFRLLRLAVVLVFMSFTLLPWLARNNAAFGKPFPLLTGSGLQYWIADKCYFHGVVTTEAAFDAISDDFQKKYNRPLILAHGGIIPGSDDLLLLADAKQDLLTYPQKIPVRFLNGLWRFWAPTDKGLSKSIKVGLSNAPFLLFFSFCIFFGISRKTINVREISVLLLILVFYGTFAMLQAISVYFDPIIPAMIALSLSILCKSLALSPKETLQPAT